MTCGDDKGIRCVLGHANLGYAMAVGATMRSMSFWASIPTNVGTSQVSCRLIHATDRFKSDADARMAMVATT